MRRMRRSPPWRLVVLTAASGTEVASWDDEARHGMFTHHLLDALYGQGDADGDGRGDGGGRQRRTWTTR